MIDYQKLWGAWLLYFIVVEFYALKTVGTEGTFSHWVWQLLNVDEGWNWRLIPALIFMGWLLVHFIFQETKF